MKTRILVILGLLLGLASSGSAFPQEDVRRVVESFYAQYYKECLGKPSKGDPDEALIRWVMANSYLSDGFKSALRKTVLNARKKNPELGLGFDPILEAQDYPDKGYRAKAIKISDKKANVTMEGIDAGNFQILVDLLSIKGQWLINGIRSIDQPAK